MIIYKEKIENFSQLIKTSIFYFISFSTISFLFFYFFLSGEQYLFNSILIAISFGLYGFISPITKIAEVFYVKDNILSIISFEMLDFFQFIKMHEKDSNIDIDSLRYERVLVIKRKRREKRFGSCVFFKLIGDEERISTKKKVAYKHILRNQKITVKVNKNTKKKRELLIFLENMQ